MTICEYLFLTLYILSLVFVISKETFFKVRKPIIHRSSKLLTRRIIQRDLSTVPTSVAFIFLMEGIPYFLFDTYLEIVREFAFFFVVLNFIVLPVALYIYDLEKQKHFKLNLRLQVATGYEEKWKGKYMIINWFLGSHQRDINYKMGTHLDIGEWYYCVIGKDLVDDRYPKVELAYPLEYWHLDEYLLSILPEEERKKLAKIKGRHC